MDFGEELHKMFLAGVGAMAITGDKAKALIEELVKRGELTVAQGKVLNEELQQKIKTKMQEAVGCKPNAEHVSECIEKMTPEERAAIRAKLEELEKSGTAKSEETAPETGTAE